MPNESLEPRPDRGVYGRRASLISALSAAALIEAPFLRSGIVANEQYYVGPTAVVAAVVTYLIFRRSAPRN